MREVLLVRGVVLPEEEYRNLYVVDGRVSYQPATADVVAEGWVVPGLVDAHCHIGLDSAGAVDAATQESQAVHDRDAGTLLVRDCGSPVDTHWLDGRAELPRVIRAGRHIARPRRYLRDLGVEVEPSELAAEASRQAARGDGWVKLVGDWIDRDRGDLAPCWPPAAVRAAVAAAHAAGARLTVHVYGAEAVGELLTAGVDCVEHGTGLGAPEIARMVELGTALVPTLINIDNFPGIAASAAAKFPAYAAHLRRLHANSRETVRSAYDAAVPIFAGTDAGGNLRHGLIAAEVTALHEAGLPAAAALAAASWAARRWLGRPATLAEGDPADLVVYDVDPRAELSVLAHPRRIILRGAVVR